MAANTMSFDNIAIQCFPGFIAVSRPIRPSKARKIRRFVCFVPSTDEHAIGSTFTSAFTYPKLNVQELTRVGGWGDETPDKINAFGTSSNGEDETIDIYGFELPITTNKDDEAFKKLPIHNIMDASRFEDALL